MATLSTHDNELRQSLQFYCSSITVREGQGQVSNSNQGFQTQRGEQGSFEGGHQSPSSRLPSGSSTLESMSSLIRQGSLKNPVLGCIVRPTQCKHLHTFCPTPNLGGKRAHQATPQAIIAFPSMRHWQELLVIVRGDIKAQWHFLLSQNYALSVSDIQWWQYGTAPNSNTGEKPNEKLQIVPGNLLPRKVKYTRRPKIKGGYMYKVGSRIPFYQMGLLMQFCHCNVLNHL